MDNLNNKELIKIEKSLFKRVLDKIKKVFFKNEAIEISKNEKNIILDKQVNTEELSKKIKDLKEEYNILSQKLEKKIEELKAIRIEELEMTLKIYKLEEIYLKKILCDKKKVI